VTRKKQSSVRCFPKNDEASFHADILKIGHHGSKNSTTPDFLSAVNPQIAIISSGEGNPYGHPRPEILDRLQTAGVRTLRPDTNGAIHPHRWQTNRSHLLRRVSRPGRAFN
jgi:beta-lactamase superfamily II metal-dependent hydrolase